MVRVNPAPKGGMKCKGLYAPPVLTKNIIIMTNLLIAKDGVDVLEKLVQLMGDQDHLKIDNNGLNSGLMPVSLEWVADYGNGRKVLSVAHYYEQNGDLMADPEMTFLRVDDGMGSVLWVALSFKQDGMFATYRESVILDEKGYPTKYLPKRAVDDRVFTTQWMKNIKQQQLNK